MTVRDFLRIERRSYIFGTLAVLLISTAALVALQYLMEPQVYAPPLPTTVTGMMQRLSAAADHLSQGQALVLELVQLAGAVALFFLNYRFSLVLRRPRAAFVLERRAWLPRLGWTTLLVANSMFFQLLLPQVLTTMVLAHWGRQELERTPPPPPSTPEPEA